MAMSRPWPLLASLVLRSAVTAFILVEARPGNSEAQVVAPTSTVFDGVTVVDVEHGKLVRDQRVIIAGNRIQAVGAAGMVEVPAGARVIEAQGKYLIPGLWDMHHHTGMSLSFLLLIANGVTGIRDAGSDIPLDTLIHWRREIIAGRRAGPPRQILSGRFIDEGCQGLTDNGVCVANGDVTAARRVVDSLKATGADMIKIHVVPSRAVYFAIAAEARKSGIRFGGHANGPAAEDSDSGASILDHSSALGASCAADSGSIEACTALAERFRRNGTWWVPTCIGFVVCGGGRAGAIGSHMDELMAGFKDFSVLNPYRSDDSGHSVLREAMPRPSGADSAVSSLSMHWPREAGIPILIGTDVVGDIRFPQVSGFALHAEMAMDVAEGLSPLAVLQGATLNPAKLLHATDSLGTVAPGKLADLVLLDANPLADITNTTLIYAVVANGRYFDRAALDGLLAEYQAGARILP